MTNNHAAHKVLQPVHFHEPIIKSLRRIKVLTLLKRFLSHLSPLISHLSSLTYNLTRFSRKLFVTTVTELIAMAAPAIIGLSRKPVNGYSAPAAIGMAIIL